MRLSFFCAVLLFVLGISSPLFASVPAPYIPELTWEASNTPQNFSTHSEQVVTQEAFTMADGDDLLAVIESQIEDETSEDALLVPHKKSSGHLDYLNAARYMMTCA